MEKSRSRGLTDLRLRPLFVSGVSQTNDKSPGGHIPTPTGKWPEALSTKSSVGSDDTKDQKSGYIMKYKCKGLERGTKWREGREESERKS